MNGSHSTSMMADLLRIKALTVQFLSDTIHVHELPMLRNCAVSALVYFNWNKYLFPQNNHMVLVFHIIAADLLGTDHFLKYVEEKLCIPTTCFTTSNDFLDIYLIVRDRYRLATRVRMSPKNVCYECKNVSPEITERFIVVCGSSTEFAF